MYNARRLRRSPNIISDYITKALMIAEYNGDFSVPRAATLGVVLLLVSFSHVEPRDCLSHPSTNGCLNGGSCVLRRINIDYFWICVCPPQWSGLRCEVWNPCTSQPCQHAGSCEWINDGVVCRCPAQWHGAFCEMRNPCNSDPCLHAGTCRAIPEVDDFRCQCPFPYTGKICEIKALQGQRNCHDYPHERTKCKHGGSCVRRQNQRWHCACTNLWIGPQCETPLADVLDCRPEGNVRNELDAVEHFYCETGSLCMHQSSSGGASSCDCILSGGKKTPCQTAMKCTQCKDGKCDPRTGACLEGCVDGASFNCSEAGGSTMKIELSFDARFTSKLNLPYSPEFLHYQETFRSYVETSCDESASLEEACNMLNFSLSRGSVVASADIGFPKAIIDGKVPDQFLRSLEENVHIFKRNGLKVIPDSLSVKTRDGTEVLQESPTEEGSSDNQVKPAILALIFGVPAFLLMILAITLFIFWKTRNAQRKQSRSFQREIRR